MATPNASAKTISWSISQSSARTAESRGFLGISSTRISASGFTPAACACSVSTPPVDNAAVAQMKEIDGDERRLCVKGEDVRIISLHGGHLLLLLHLLHRRDEVAEIGCLLEAHVLGGIVHTVTQPIRKIAVPAFEE